MLKCIIENYTLQQVNFKIIHRKEPIEINEGDKDGENTWKIKKVMFLNKKKWVSELERWFILCISIINMG